MPELSKKCPKCNGYLKYKYAQYVDYLICQNCNEKFTESKFRLGERTEDQTELFNIVAYKQKNVVNKTMIYFAGANNRGINQAKKALNQSRLYKFADAYQFNIICVGIKNTHFEDMADYRPLIKYILSKHQIQSENVILVGFSNGGIPTFLTGCYFNFYRVCFISPVLSYFVNKFCERINNNVIIINNLKDTGFSMINISLQKLLKENNKKVEVVSVDTGHISTKSFEKLVWYLFEK